MQVAAYIGENLSAELSVTLLAAKFGFSRPTLQRNFRIYFQMPVYAYIYEKRMEKAEELLRRGGMTVEEIGLEVGYTSLSAFSAAFKKKYLLSPLHYLLQLNIPPSAAENRV
ncbi:MAG: helix-turn-helix domain-containing protein [Flavobacteriales bacterium]